MNLNTLHRSPKIAGPKFHFVLIIFFIAMSIAAAIFWYTDNLTPMVVKFTTKFVNSLIETTNFSTTGNLSTEENVATIPLSFNFKVICMILTTPSNWETKGKAVRNTWAKRCHKAIFFYSKISPCTSRSICNETNAVGLDIPDGRDHLTAKTLGSLSYSYTQYGEEADYFLKADDDTYVIMENIQQILFRFRSITLLYLGKKFTNILPHGYASGGAGYLISNQAAKLLVQNRSLHPDECHKDGGFEDVEIGRCLAKFGIFPQDELDSNGKLIFHPENPLHVMQGGGLAPTYCFISINGAEFGNKNAIQDRGFMLSKRTATLHYVTPPEMYMFEFLLYHLSR